MAFSGFFRVGLDGLETNYQGKRWKNHVFLGLNGFEPERNYL